MQLQYLLPAAFLAASTMAAKFNGFSNIACQQYDGTYIPLTATQLQDIVVKNWATTQEIPEASRSFTAPDDRKLCPSNSDDTYKWVSIPQWGQGSKWPAGNGGALAVVYYKETDTYNVCRYLAAAQADGYKGACK
ncbi:uncharacterized protein J4E84_007404 [Alternaria hordeiaustralica]|uniref:uncharacterized protein n=1 Tax=Alternaria hordeiaustralica TaxID=1187925 RepID=UPI0020C33944|nr:uncharacterized protein J4E84_007404 [Alternaria hordeiaustralica]KAI4681808.1 hypothetical protein J4E84_007404 [Alternaria hordeiaustralica]